MERRYGKPAQPRRKLGKPAPLPALRAYDAFYNPRKLVLEYRNAGRF